MTGRGTRPAGSNHLAIGVREPPGRDITPTTVETGVASYVASILDAFEALRGSVPLGLADEG
jgi:hypothetical protein